MHDHTHLHEAGSFSAGNLLLLAAACLLALLYLAGVWRQRHWSGWRSACFLLGSAVVAVSLFPSLAARAHHDLPTHMVQHLLLGMLGPLGLVLGTPVTLALRSLPAARSRGLVRLLRARPIRFVSHPVAALILNIGGMGVLYLTPLYARMSDHPMLHLLVHFHFFTAGCLFCWAILELEPAAGRRTSAPFRLAVLFVAVAAHACISKAMYAYHYPQGTEQPLVSIEQAAKIMYYGGDAAELLLMIGLFATWPIARSPRQSPSARPATSGRAPS